MRTNGITKTNTTPNSFKESVKEFYYKNKINLWLLFIVALFLTLIMFFPIFWMIRISFTMREHMFVLPPPPFLEISDIHGYIAIFNMPEFLRYYLNSVIVSLGTVVVSLFAGTLAAYSFSRFKYKGRNLFMLIALSAQMFPWAMLLVSLYLMFQKVGLLNTYQGLIFAHTTFALPLTIWITKSYFDTLPRELEESAIIDGCGKLRILRSIIFPLSRPGIAAAAIYIFIFSWNDFLFGLTLTTEDKMRILAPGVALTFIAERKVLWGEMMASAVIVTLPIIIIFLFLQRHFIAGLTAGAVKQ